MMGLADLCVKGGTLQATATTGDPAFSCGVRFRARNFSAVEIRMALEGAQKRDTAQLFWATTLAGTSEPASTRVDAIVDGQMHTYRFDVGANKLWRGIVTTLRFDPCVTPGTKISVDYIRVLP
ncbi:MAG: hypothetical protein H5T86_11080 [Armatimonadetes bacterium]|nr:hypothetical protein [Armatimonadota bacterium]